MTKMIKFNLILDGKPVRDLEGLQQNYNLDDIYATFQSGVLARWLEVRGYDEHLAKIKAVESTDEIFIAEELAKIFNVTPSGDEVRKSVYAAQFRKKEKENLEKLEKNKFEHDQVISKYHEGYNILLNEIKGKSNDYLFLKQAVSSLWDNYRQLFIVDFTRFYEEMASQCLLIFFTMLANDNYRQSDLFDEKIKASLFHLIPQTRKVEKENYKEDHIERHEGDTNHNWRKITDFPVIIKGVYSSRDEVKIKGNKYDDNTEYSMEEAIGKIFRHGFAYCSYYPSDYVEYAKITMAIKVEDAKFDPPYKSFNGETQGYWKDLEPKGRKFLILKMEDGNYIRNSSKSGEGLRAKDVNGKFLILDGIDYKSNNASHDLVYMEV